jgi:hypothetical protein
MDMRFFTTCEEELGGFLWDQRVSLTSLVSGDAKLILEYVCWGLPLSVGDGPCRGEVYRPATTVGIGKMRFM